MNNDNYISGELVNFHGSGLIIINQHKQTIGKRKNIAYNDDHLLFKILTIKFIFKKKIKDPKQRTTTEKRKNIAYNDDHLLLKA